jgi:RNA polymerase sigma factor (sigma-70 family)
MTDTAELLRGYTSCGSEKAFAEIVHRYIDLVYSTALRKVNGDTFLAEDVAQMVFTDLARKAKSLPAGVVLGGWLHHHTCFLAANAVRSERRRQTREQKAAEMDATPPPTNDCWNDLAPLLDDALERLSAVDRDAIVLRFFEDKSLGEVARVLSMSDDAAQKRVSRAVERLREFFTKRGVTFGAGGLAVVISANAVQAAPAGLAATISSAAALAGTTITATTAATITKAIVMTTLQKTLITATIAIAVGAGIYEARQASQLREQVQTLQRQQASYGDEIQRLQRERDDASDRLARLADENAALKNASAESVRFQKELARQKADSAASAAAKSWLDRVTRLKQRMEQTPNAKIPELQFVTEQDWLNATKGELNTDADYRRALSVIRDAGESKVVPMIQLALGRYMHNNNGQFPTDLDQLQPYFDKPLDDAILQRWEIAPAKTVENLRMGGDTIITQKAPVDDVFDSRVGIGPDGYGTTDFLSGETQETMTPVWDAYRAAHNGQWYTNVSQVEPYITTSEQRAAFDKLMLRYSISKQFGLPFNQSP